MKTPPLLMGAALLFWGWQCGYLLLSIPMAVLLEGTRVVSRRWDLSPRDFYRLSDLCAVIFLGMFAVRFLGQTASMARWLPFGLFPLLLAQALSSGGGVDMGALFYTARRRERRRRDGRRKLLDVSWPAFALVLLATSAANVRTPIFYAGLVTAAGWALWSVRPRQRHPALWMLFLLTAAGLGAVGHVGLNRLHIWVEGKTSDWYIQFTGRDRSPFQNVTALGDVRRIKLSNRIVMRIEVPRNLPPSHLLREASYNIYRTKIWLASDARFAPLRPVADQRAWNLAGGSVASLMDISTRLRRGTGILSLPLGAVRIENLPAERLERNPFGAVRVQGGPGVVRYRVACGPRAVRDAVPGPKDRFVPPPEAPAVREIVDRLGLTADRPAEAAKRLNDFFQREFTYTLDLGESGRGRTPVQNFLTRSRRGHCEFFATAAVLILRAAGIPARYATGYLMHEFSRIEGAYIVRARHGHAWVLAHIDGAWRDVDPTPPSWPRQEQAEAPLMEPLYDLLRWAGFRISRWRWAEREGGIPGWTGWLAVLLGVIVIWRIVSRRRTSRTRRRSRTAGGTGEFPAVPSPFARIDTMLAKRGFARRTGETQQRRLQRLAAAGDDPQALTALRHLLATHYRLRFHPRGLSASDSESFGLRVDAWLARWET